jgi:hypothetical protein
MRPKPQKTGAVAQKFGRTMREMFRINVSFSGYVLCVHVKKLS